MAGGRDDEEEEEEEGARDCFFNSIDRVPSGVSIAFDVHSSGSSDGDDVRFSFSSAVAPSSFRRRASFNISDEDNMEQEEEEEEEVGGGGGGAGDFDYGIWMAEPISVKERRRRLLQDMGLASRRDLTAGAQSRRIPSFRIASTRFTSTDPDSAAPGGPTPTLPPEPPPTPPPPTTSHPPTITRCRSDSQLSRMRVDDPIILFRSPSAPASFSLGRGAAGGGRGGGGQILIGKGVEMPQGTPAADDQIKNPDAAVKEFVVSSDDSQTGIQAIQLTGEPDQLLGCSPIDKELIRRANSVIVGGDDNKTTADNDSDNYETAPAEAAASDGQAVSSKNTSSKPPGGKKKGGWLKNIKCVASSVTGGLISADKEKDHSSNGSERLKVHQHGKSYKELTGLYMCQEIQAHQGSIWTIKFSNDSRYLASAGEDRVVHVWEVLECDILSSSLRRQDQTQSSPPPQPPLPLPKGSSVKQTSQPSKRTKKGGKVSSGSKTNSLPDYIVMPETVFSLSQNPVHSFQGHLDDVLDLSWSKSQCLLSSSMDKTVRLWDLETKACLKLFAHNDYVTCIQFNPLDDRYFISGSLDAKVRIWSIPDRQVVDWSDLHEMVTAACYTPDGQGAIIGSHKGSCRLYNTSDNKLCEEGRIDIQNKKRKSNAKKITGFQFAPGNPSEVLITSADSRIRVFAGVDMVHKFRGFRNTSSQISASCSSDGKYVVCASEDSHVYLWQRNRARSAGAGGKGKGWVTTRSHEHFDCKDVSVAIPWPSGGSNCEASPSLPSWSGRVLAGNTALPNLEVSRSKNGSQEESGSSSLSSSASSSSAAASSSRGSGGKIGGNVEAANAWGLVVVTAGLGGNIRIYQNFGLPLRLTNLF